MPIVCAWALGATAPPLPLALMVSGTDIVGLAPLFISNLEARKVIFSL